MDNRDCLIKELDVLLENLDKYRTALKEENSAMLNELFKEGKEIKEEVDG